MSTRPQLCAQLGMDSQGCSYSAALLVTSVPPVMNPQVSAVRSNRRSPHVVDNPGGSALCRPVDSVEPLCTTLRVDNTVCIQLVTDERLPSRVGRGPRRVLPAPSWHRPVRGQGGQGGLLSASAST